MPKCPRDATELKPSERQHMQLEHCDICGGDWYKLEELAALEATVATSDVDRAGTIEYAKRESTLACPVCAKPMVAFDYRGNNLELDACPDEHGFWLDAGEADRVREIMKDRMDGLLRSASAESSWNRDREAGFSKGGIVDQIKGLFRRR